MMTNDEKQKLVSECGEMLDIIKEYAPFKVDGTYNAEAVRPAVLEIINYIIQDKDEAASLCDWLDKTDFWTAPASTRFHGNYKCGLALHTLKVIQQCLVFAPSVMENFWTCPDSEKYNITAEDIFVASLCHDFCKTGFYAIEYRNTKDITGNWVKTPFYKTRADNRNLGHGNESVLMLLEIMPSYINKRYVLEAVSRHMGFSDLSESESYNYSLFLENPLVVLLQLADQTAAQWFKF
jgi:hypothetical protein